MTFVHSNSMLLLIHSLVFSCLWGKRKLFPLCIYMSKTERKRSVKSAYWLRWRQRQREMNAENALSLSLLLAWHSVTSTIFLFFPSYFCLHIAYRQSSSRTICCYHDVLPRVSLNIYKNSEMKENEKSNFNAYTYDSLLLLVTSSREL